MKLLKLVTLLLLLSSASFAQIRVLIVGGGSSHDYDRWYKEADAATLERGGLATVQYTSDPDEILPQLKNIDVLFLCNNQPLKDTLLRQGIFDFVNAGKGLILAHAAIWYNWKDWPMYNFKLVSGGSRGHAKYGDFTVNIKDAKHPVTKGAVKKFTLKDELYYYTPDPAGPGIKVLASTAPDAEGKVFPSLFVVNHPKARIVGFALGHDAESHELPVYQTILRNAVKWAAKK
ncbi:ThuA domain-containing protein [Chitinophaga sp. SYP-B3965]|uniref:ThuA domain-containing protein n=1 Tax=Chitinophaga sp. SYP-B3965 TaxID=2663120 RepID=UPI001299E211|nr:ThuA domain-containing protein [Chitinophaga sp. SYP-B3965]MRG44696.1 ThuA domain-containing protein [Chitinophaga sp. SYP-B3965]